MYAPVRRSTTFGCTTGVTVQLRVAVKGTGRLPSLRSTAMVPSCRMP